MQLIYKLPDWVRWILLPFASIISWLLVNILAKFAAKILLFLSNTGWSENFFEYFLNPGFAGFCAVYSGMVFAPKNKKLSGYVVAFLWIALSAALAVFDIMTTQWPALLASITTIAGCYFAICEPPPENDW